MNRMKINNGDWIKLPNYPNPQSVKSRGWKCPLCGKPIEVYYYMDGRLNLYHCKQTVYAVQFEKPFPYIDNIVLPASISGKA